MSLKIDLYNEDCLQVLKSISPKSIDLIFCDLPYCGMTNSLKDSEVACKWNTPVDLEILWKLFKRIRKDTTPIFFCCSTKFGYSLIKANEKEFRYDLVWIKSAPTNFLNAKRMPLKKNEKVYVFYKKCPSETYSKNIALHHKHKYLDSKNGMKGQDNLIYGKSAKQVQNKKYDPKLPTDIIKCNTYNNGNELPDYRDKDKKGIQYEPKLPTDIIKDSDILDGDTYNTKNRNKPLIRSKSNQYDPKLPTDIIKCNTYNNGNELYRNKPNQYDPKLPTDIIKDNDKVDQIRPAEYVKEYKISEVYGNIEEIRPKNQRGIQYDPKLPTDIIKEDYNTNTLYGDLKVPYPNKKRTANYEPKLPTDIIKDNENEIYDSKKNNIYRDNLEIHTFKKRDEPTYDPRLPDDILEFKSEKSKHQTQKPVTLTDFILKYYSNEGDTILDPTMGSGTMGISCKKLKRNFIGCELDKDIFKNAEDRINNFKG